MQRTQDTIGASADLTRRALKLMQYLVGILMASTIILLLWQHFGMERVIELSATSGHQYEIRDDRFLDHGDSVGSLAGTGSVLKFGCKLVKKIDYPYCSLWFPVGKEPNGIDLSQFDTLSFDMRHTGPAPHTVKVFIRNFEQQKSNVEDWGSQRVNEIEFEVPAHGVQNVPISLLHTATWWVKKRQLSLLDTAVRLDNVMSIEVATGTFNTPGQHYIELRSIKVHGKWISQNRLLLILVGLWFTCGIIWPLLRAIHLRHELANREARLAMLSAINQALQLETKELTGQAYSDELTGALNRQGLRDALVNQWHAPAPKADTASVIFLDLDHFKRINDEHGHPVGDEVLRRLAGMVHAEIRASDKLVRWGGEEFLIVCPKTSAFQAQRLAEKLRLGMAQQAWPAGLHVTASFGVTALGEDEDIGEAIKRADEALYRAKANGRNCVELATPAPETVPAEAEMAI